MLCARDVVDWINEDCERGRYFFACGLAKEANVILREAIGTGLLRDDAEGMVIHYAADGRCQCKHCVSPWPRAR